MRADEYARAIITHGLTPKDDRPASESWQEYVDLVNDAIDDPENGPFALVLELTANASWAIHKLADIQGREPIDVYRERAIANAEDIESAIAGDDDIEDDE